MDIAVSDDFHEISNASFVDIIKRIAQLFFGFLRRKEPVEPVMYVYRFTRITGFYSLNPKHGFEP